jgi:hypothetical protein
MKDFRKKIFSVLLCCLLVFLLIGCDDSTSEAIEDINNEVRSYDEVDISDVPDLEDGSQDFSNLSEIDDFNAESFIDENLGEMMMMMASGLGSVSNVAESCIAGDGSLANSKDMEMGFAIHIDDEEMYYTENGEVDYDFSMDIDWFDLVVVGSTTTSIVDILNDGFCEVVPDMSLYLSTHFILGFNGDYDYLPYSLKLNIETDQDSSGDIVASGSLNLSFASRVVIDSNLGVIGFKLDIADFEDLTEADFDAIEDIFDELDSESDLDETWEDIEQIIWGNTDDTHISLEVNVADSTGLLGTKLYEDEDLFHEFIGVD